MLVEQYVLLQLVIIEASRSNRQFQLTVTFIIIIIVSFFFFWRVIHHTFVIHRTIEHIHNSLTHCTSSIHMINSFLHYLLWLLPLMNVLFPAILFYTRVYNTSIIPSLYNIIFRFGLFIGFYCLFLFCSWKWIWHNFGLFIHSYVLRGLHSDFR